MSTITKMRVESVEEVFANRPLLKSEAQEQKRAYIADATILLSRMNLMREEACRLHSRLRMGTDHSRALDHLLAACEDFENAFEDGLAHASKDVAGLSQTAVLRG